MFKKVKKITSLLLTVSMLISFGFPSYAYGSETEDLYANWGLPVVQINNGVIRVTADKQTGRFIIETLGGVPYKSSDDYKDLLYGNRFEGPETSYTTVRIDGEDYIYGNDYGFLDMEGHYIIMPYADPESNSIISKWAIKDVEITQRITLVNSLLSSSVGNASVSYEIVNKSKTNKNVGLRSLLDTKIGTVDSPALTVPGGGFIYRETEYIGDEIPSLWYAYEQYVTPQIIAMGPVSGEGMTKPDKLQFAAWKDVSLTKWDYNIDASKAIIKVTVDGKPYEDPNGAYPDESVVDYAALDSCAVLYWNPITLAPGEQKNINTSYGVGDASQKEGDPGYRIGLQGTDKLNMKSDKSSYSVEYVNAEFNIDNNFDTSKNIENLQIDLELPDELELVEGDAKMVIKTLPAGSYHRSMWKIKPTVQDNFKISAYSVILRAEGIPIQRITKVLIMEGKGEKMPDVSFLDVTPKTPFYVYDMSRSIFMGGKGFSALGSAVSHVADAKLIQGNQKYTLDYNTIRYISDTVITAGIPDGLPEGTYDLFISISDATKNKNDQKTFTGAVTISDDIKYSQNMVAEVEFPLVMKDDGKNTPAEKIKIYGKFIDNKNGTYTSVGATSSNPVKINNVLKYAGGTLSINTNPTEAYIGAYEGTLWCDITKSGNNTAVQGIIAIGLFEFRPQAKAAGENDTFVRMVYDTKNSGAKYDVSYENVPITIDSVILNSDGLDIKGSMGILNPLTYGSNGFTPSGDINKQLENSFGMMMSGYAQAQVDNVSITEEGMDIEGKFKFKMPFTLSLFAGVDATLEINTKQEHIVVEVDVSIAQMMDDSAGAKARIGLRKGRFDEIYVGADLPTPYTVAPPVPIGISSFAGGLTNLSFAGAFPISIIVGLGIQDSTGIEVLGYNLLEAEGNITLSPFHLEGNLEVDMFMMDMADAAIKFVWATWDPEIEKRGISIDATLYYYIFKGNVHIQYFEGESFLGRGVLTVFVPEIVPFIGGLELAGVMAELTQYYIAGAVSVLDMDIGIKYYFATGKAEFLELKEELERSGSGIIVEYGDGVIAQYGYNYLPIQYMQYADADSQYITELNLTDNSNAMLVLKMTQQQYENLNEESIKLITPNGEILKIIYKETTDLVNADGTIRETEKNDGEMIAVRQKINRYEEGLENIYMVTIPVANPENGQWTIITKGSMEILPYSSMKNPEITEFEASYDPSERKIKAEWVLNGEPDKFRIYVVNADDVSENEYNNPASMWGKGTLLYGQNVETAEFTDSLTGKTTEKETGVIYTAPSPDGANGSFTTEHLNLPTGKYFVYAKADKENTVAAYRISNEINIYNASTPDAPAGLLIKDKGNNKISISWDADYSMDKYFVYKKASSNDNYDKNSPAAVYEVYEPEDYAPDFVNWPGFLPKERLGRFEVIIDGDTIDESNPKDKTYYFDVRALGTNQSSLRTLSALPPDVTLGEPASGAVTLSPPEAINVYTEIKSADSKITQVPYLEKDSSGIYRQYYKYVTNSKNIIIAGNSSSKIKYSIIHNNAALKSTNTGYDEYFSENITLDDGINYFVAAYENEGGDTLIEEFIVEYDDKAPVLVITAPKDGAVSQNGKINVSGMTEPYGIITINNINYNADENGAFSEEINFGTSYISKLLLEARDAAGNIAKAELSILNDSAEIEDISLIPEYKIMSTGMSQQLLVYVSNNDVLGEKLSPQSVKYSIIQGSDLAFVDKDGKMTAKYEGTVIVKAELYLTDTFALSDSIAIEVTGDKKPGGSKYKPPVYSNEMLIWLAGNHMSTEGGTIRTENGVELYIPIGSLPYYLDNIDIFAFRDYETLINSMGIPDTASAASQPYLISLVTDFVKPAMLTLPVNKTNKAYIYRYDEESGALIYMGGKMSSDGTFVTAPIMKHGTYIALNNPYQDIFTDISSDYWGYDYIYGLNFLGIVNGYSGNGGLSFRPAANITRAEFIKLLVCSRNINLSEADGIELKFADNETIPAWAIPYVKAALMKGLINGKDIEGKSYFAAEDYITREEIAAIMGRSIDMTSSGSNLFSDSGKINLWALEHVMKLAEAGIITGYDDNTFRPSNNASRTEACTIIYRYLIFIK